MAIDADTTLAPGRDRAAPRRLRRRASVAAACGFVLPRRVRTIWERGRYVEYLLAFSFFKRIQDHYGKPLISSGCFSIYRTAELRDARRLVDADDGRGHGPDLDDVRGRPQGPLRARGGLLPDRAAQLRFHGQAAAALVARLHPERAAALAVAAARSATCARPSRSPSGTRSWPRSPTWCCCPLLAIAVDPLILLAYLVDAPVVLVPVLWQAARPRRDAARRSPASRASSSCGSSTASSCCGALWTRAGPRPAPARLREGPLMSAGLPGLGLGGLFFILSALLAPLLELGRPVRGRSSRAWRRSAASSRWLPR